MTEHPSEPALTCVPGTPEARRLRLGARVVLRYRDPAGDLTDALGELVAYDDDTATVHTRRGDVRVPRPSIVTGKEVPPAPRRPGRPHRVIDAVDLQRVMVDGLPPLRSRWLGEWLLRSADGYTGRANSVLPLGDPGMDLASAIVEVERWYAELGQPALVQVFGPTIEDAYATDLGRHLLDAGWQPLRPTLILTAATDTVVAATDRAEVAAVTDRVDERWLAGATAREQEHAQTLTTLLDRIPDARYVTLGTGHIPDAVGRVALSPGWAGLFAVHVQPQLRRRGLARTMVGALAREAQAAGARSMYLQVEATNEPAVELYRSLGFEIHHEYAYLHRA